MDSASSVTELCKEVNLLHAIRWIVKSWKSVKVNTIQKCFTLVGFKEDSLCENDCGESGEDEDDDVPLAVLVREL